MEQCVWVLILYRNWHYRRNFYGEILPHIICLTLVVMPRLHASNAEQKPKHSDPFIIQFINLTFKDVHDSSTIRCQFRSGDRKKFSVIRIGKIFEFMCLGSEKEKYSRKMDLIYFFQFLDKILFC